ncbi:MAG TPA: M23 family peptidase [Bacteroidales bacterium]|nr:MAG: hypothetical protein A2W98_07495 [Bacteroidetes bacterium GWF2_33_38]HBF87245.1 M23 family peptidase [Bacteroidales bacterium]
MKFLFTLIFSFVFSCLFAQQKQYPQYDFCSPLDIPLSLAGNFGELRPNHFHAGVDFRTQAKEGFSIYAIADGYVSRIKITTGGYGKSIYITHPNGYVSVYAHLKSLNSKISEFLKKAQYDRKTYEIDVFPSPNQLPVKQKDIIGLSGNTGTSSGPHLHFEIRDAVTEFAVNPLLFNFKVADNVAPEIYNVQLYPLDEKSFVNGKNEKATFTAVKSGGSYILKEPNITVSGSIGFAISANDFLTNSDNSCGIYSLELTHDGTLVYQFEFDEISFFESRYVNAHMDYYQNRFKRKTVHKAFREPNNHLHIYNTSVNDGNIYFDDDNNHQMSFELKDSYKNTATINFQVKSTPTSNNPKIKKSRSENYKVTMPCNIDNLYKDDEISVWFPVNTLYDTLDFEFHKSEKIANSISPVFHIHNKYIPVHNYFTISIKSADIPEKYKSKALVATFDSKGRVDVVGGNFLNDYVVADINEFGAYFVVIDTLAPKIIPANFENNSNLEKQENIQVKISDDISGIKNYEGYIDGCWVLFEYEPKRNMLIYHFDEKRLKKGQNHTLKIKVEDWKDNITIFDAKFYW